MKNDKKVFFLIEAVLGIMVVVLAFLMLQEKNGKDLAKVSIISRIRRITSGLVLSTD